MARFWKLKNLLLSLPGITFAGALLYIAYLICKGEYNVSEEFIIALLTLGLTWYLWVLKSDYDKRREMKRLTYESRQKSYDALLKPFVNQFREIAVNKNVDPNTLKQELVEAGVKLTIYGSDEVISAYENFKKLGQEQPLDNYELLSEFGKLILNIRKDTGFPETEITVKEILKSFIVDYDQNASKIEKYL